MGGKRTLECDLKPVKLNDLAVLYDRCGNQPHPPLLSNGRLYLNVDCKAALVLDGVGAKRFHGCA